MQACSVSHNFVTYSADLSFFLFSGWRHNWGGNVTDWWSEKLLTDFSKRAMCLVKQYSKYKLDVVGKNVSSTTVNGQSLQLMRHAITCYSWIDEFWYLHPSVSALTLSCQTWIGQSCSLQVNKAAARQL